MSLIKLQNKDPLLLNKSAAHLLFPSTTEATDHFHTEEKKGTLTKTRQEKAVGKATQLMRTSVCLESITPFTPVIE